jgi:transposase
MISAITNRGKLAFMVFERTFTAAVFVEFLRRLVRHAGRKVFLIVDGHPVHEAARVERWLKRHRKRLRLFFLPGYSPELNPDELLNQDVKTNAVGRKRPRHRGELMGNVRRHLWSTQRQPEKVRRYFQEPRVRYAAA